MNSVTKNIVTILGVLTVAFAGYYFYAQKASLEPVTDDLALQDMLAKTGVFIGHSQELDKMSFDLTVFEDERFKTVRSFAGPVEEQSVGRTNPFASVGNEVFVNTESE